MCSFARHAYQKYISFVLFECEAVPSAFCDIVIILYAHFFRMFCIFVYSGQFSSLCFPLFYLAFSVFLLTSFALSSGFSRALRITAAIVHYEEHDCPISRNMRAGSGLFRFCIQFVCLICFFVFCLCLIIKCILFRRAIF